MMRCGSAFDVEVSSLHDSSKQLEALWLKKLPKNYSYMQFKMTKEIREDPETWLSLSYLWQSILF